MKLILASSSKYRAELLKNAGFDPLIKKPEVDEDLIKIKLKMSTPLFIAQKLAEAKANKVSDLILAENQIESPWIIIGSDQVCVFNNEIFDKPENFEKNFLHLKKLQGQTHSLITCVCLIYNLTLSKEKPNLKKIEFHNQTELTMRPLSDQQITEYLNLDKPFDCAGGYRFELNGKALMENILTDDETSIQGLPMIQTVRYLEDLRGD